MSDMSHREALQNFLEGVRRAEGAARIMGHYRQDPRWIAISSALGMIFEKAKRLEAQRTAPSLIIPEGYSPRSPN